MWTSRIIQTLPINNLLYLPIQHEVSGGKGSIKRHDIFGSIIQHEISAGETLKWVYQSTSGFRFIK